MSRCERAWRMCSQPKSRSQTNEMLEMLQYSRPPRRRNRYFHTVETAFVKETVVLETRQFLPPHVWFFSGAVGRQPPQGRLDKFGRGCRWDIFGFTEVGLPFGCFVLVGDLSLSAIPL